MDELGNFCPPTPTGLPVRLWTRGSEDDDDEFITPDEASDDEDEEEEDTIDVDNLPPMDKEV